MPHEMSRDFSHPASFHVILSASVAPHWQTRATQWRGWPKHTTLTICVIMSNLEGNPKIWNTWAQPPCSRGVGDPLEIHLSSHVFPAESNGTSVINEIHLKNTLIPCVLPFKVTHMVTWTRPCTGIQRSKVTRLDVNIRLCPRSLTLVRLQHCLLTYFSSGFNYNSTARRPLNQSIGLLRNGSHVAK